MNANSDTDFGVIETSADAPTVEEGQRDIEQQERGQQER
jgi:hypothetical protein